MDEPVLFTHLYQMVRRLHEMAPRLPKVHRPTLVRRLLDHSLSLMEIVTSLRYTRNRGSLFIAADRHLDHQLPTPPNRLRHLPVQLVRLVIPRGLRRGRLPGHRITGVDHLGLESMNNGVEMERALHLLPRHAKGHPGNPEAWFLGTTAQGRGENDEQR